MRMKGTEDTGDTPLPADSQDVSSELQEKTSPLTYTQKYLEMD